MEPNMEGGCTCRQVRYRLIGTPLIVHAYHCRWCQRETGTAHALNALYEADRVAGLVGIRSLDYRDRPEVMAAEAPDLQVSNKKKDERPQPRFQLSPPTGGGCAIGWAPVCEKRSRSRRRLG
jgi:hypothetical protein